MNKVALNIYTEKDMNYNESQLKRYGYKKVSDCMWAKIYSKADNEVTLNREYW